MARLFQAIVQTLMYLMFRRSHFENTTFMVMACQVRITRLIGKGKAAENILSGELIDVRQALHLGIVNK